MVHSGTSDISPVLKIREFLLHLINLHLVKTLTQNHLNLQIGRKVVQVILLQELFLPSLKEKMIKMYLRNELIVNLKLMNVL